MPRTRIDWSVRWRARTRNALARLGVCALALLQACEGSSGPAQARSYALGFTDFPNAATLEGLAAAFAVIAGDGDLAAMHFDDGVPWQEALVGAPYAGNWLAELDYKLAHIPAGHVTYLAITPIAFSRDTLAGHRGAAPNEPLEPPWDTLSFDAPEVIAAFTAHAEYMIARFQPDFFAYAIEANMLFSLKPEAWPAFVTLARATYDSVKARHPALPVFLTLQAESFHLDPPGQAEAISQILPYTDMIAVSSYGFVVAADPSGLSGDHFGALAALAPGKPFAISETGWPAEDVTAPYPTFIPADETWQRAYVERMLGDADALAAEFIVWFMGRDYDAFWETQLQFLPTAPLIRLWRDTGLYDGEGRARPALAAWREVLARPRAD